MRLFVVFSSFSIYLSLIGCKTHQKNSVSKNDHQEANVEFENKLIYCSRIFEKEKKIQFLQDVYDAFKWGDSSKISSYLVNPIDVSVKKGILLENNYIDIPLSLENVTSWTTFLKEIVAEFGNSLCTKVGSRGAEFLPENCIENIGISQKAYFKYIHFEVVNTRYVLTGIGVVIF